MVFDCYCALCGGPFDAGDIGSRAPRALEERRRRVERRRQRLQTGEEPGSDDSSEADDVDGDDDDGDSSGFDEKTSYDPEVVSEESQEWLSSVYCLGVNPEAEGADKSFIAGPGKYDGYGAICDIALDSVNQPENEEFWCYNNHTTNFPVVFPFHWCCFEILSSVLNNGAPDTTVMDKDVLYGTMRELNTGSSTLSLPYGILSGDDQFWECVPGEEFLVAHPMGSLESLSNMLSGNEFGIRDSQPSLVNAQAKVRNDPFSLLPCEILHTILVFLSGESVQAFAKASWPIHMSTRSNSFWKDVINRSFPWFWELHECLSKPQSLDLDYRTLYLWVEKMTTPTYGMTGPFMGIANRRRIYRACESLAEHYLKNQPQRDHLDHHAMEILELSESPQMPIVSYPESEGFVRPAYSLWIYSMHELTDVASIFETFWNADGFLVGLGVVFGSERRMFGCSSTTANGNQGITKLVTLIPADAWIDGLVLHIPDLDIMDPERRTAVTGITLSLNNGEEEVLGSHMGNRRPLLGNEGTCPVGLVGMIDGDGIISRLGTLVSQYSEEGDEDNEEPEEFSYAYSLLWGQSSLLVPTYVPGGRVSPWSKDAVRITDHVNSDNIHDLPNDLAPQQCLIWAYNPSELRSISRISAVVCPQRIEGGRGKKRMVDKILGLRVEYVRESKKPNRYIGMGRKTDGDGNLLDWPEDQMRHCDIDGPGGEFVSRVRVAWDDSEPKTITLHTNRARKLTLGETNRQFKWQSLDSRENEIVAGLAAMFQIGDHNADEEPTYRLSNLTALAMSAE